MTNKEKEAMDIIREHPQISQAELAKRLNITRSSVSVHISNLIKKGYIVGRGYVLNEPKYVTIIGAANMDIIGRPIDGLILEDSNPGSMEFCPGGVGRNIAENLARLSVNTKMISSIGRDVFGNMILDHSKAVGIDMDYCHLAETGTTSNYMAILKNDGELSVAISDMRLLDRMPIEHLARHQNVIKKSELLVIDAGLPTTTIEFILANFTNIPIYLDPVSIGKAKHIKHLTGRFHTIKMNRYEAEFLSGMKIHSEPDLHACAASFLNKGVKQVFISLGKEGAYYSSGDVVKHYKQPAVQVVNATGAGDAFTAGIIYCSINKRDIDFTLRFASAMSKLTLLNHHTVSPFISEENVLHELA